MNGPPANEFRIEEDSLGNVQVPANRLWGAPGSSLIHGCARRT
jgi:fumarate hydratase class II